MATKSKPKSKPKTKSRPAGILPVGTAVSWHYRSAIGHGTIAGVHKMGTTSANTEYSIRERDHHPGEPAVVYHFGRALTRSSKK